MYETLYDVFRCECGLFLLLLGSSTTIYLGHVCQWRLFRQKTLVNVAAKRYNLPFVGPTQIPAHDHIPIGQLFPF